MVNIPCNKDEHDFVKVEETMSGDLGVLIWYQCSKCGMPMNNEIEMFRGEIQTIMTREREIKINCH